MISPPPPLLSRSTVLSHTIVHDNFLVRSRGARSGQPRVEPSHRLLPWGPASKSPQVPDSGSGVLCVAAWWNALEGTTTCL